MSKPFVFVSCGQFTEAERKLGDGIVKTVSEGEVLAALPKLLESWKKIKAGGAIRVELESTRGSKKDEHQQFQMDFCLVNDSSRRIAGRAA